MAKQSGFMKRQQALKDAEIGFHRMFALQWASDAALLAANEVFHRRGDKLAEFHAAFVRVTNEIANMTLEDAKDDKTMEYTKTKVDEQLQKILGDKFVPWNERYNIK